MSLVELKSCPFCSGAAQLTHGEATDQVWAHGKFSRVFCTKCQCRQLFHRTDAEAVEAWNTRQKSDGGAEAQEVLAWLDERALKSTSFGSHCHAYELAALKLREALEKSTTPSPSLSPHHGGTP